MWTHKPGKERAKLGSTDTDRAPKGRPMVLYTIFFLYLHNILPQRTQPEAEFKYQKQLDELIQKIEVLRAGALVIPFAYTTFRVVFVPDSDNIRT